MRSCFGSLNALTKAQGILCDPTRYLRHRSASKRPQPPPCNVRSLYNRDLGGSGSDLHSKGQLGTSSVPRHPWAKCLVIICWFHCSCLSDWASARARTFLLHAVGCDHDLAPPPLALVPPIMSTPQPNAPTTPAGSPPPVIPMPTTPLGAVQTMLSMLSPPAGSQGTTPPPHPTHASPVEMISDLVPVLSSVLPAHAPPAHPHPHGPATQTPGDITMPAAASTSSHGRTTPPRAHARVTRSYSALPEISLPPPRPIPVPGGDLFRRPTGHYEYSETVREKKKESPVRSSITAYVSSWPADPTAVSSDQFNDPKMVGARLDPTVEEAEKECVKAEVTGEKAERRLLRWQRELTVYLCASFSKANGVVSQHRRRPPGSSWCTYYGRGCCIER